MEYVIFIQMLCSSTVVGEFRPANCQEYFKECVERVSKEPAAIKAGYGQDTIATYLLQNPKKRQAVCEK